MTTHANDAGPILQRIVESRRQHVKNAKRLVSAQRLRNRIPGLEPTRGFRAAVSPEKPDVAVIAELKRGSPSAGIIRRDFSPAGLARCLAENGAAALSVLTEPDFFFGDPAYLEQVRAAVSLPLLRKDFIIDPYQVYESRVLGADAALIIVKIVDRPLLADLMGIAREVGLDALVEVNTEHELETALWAGADLIGINNRDLETLAVDRDTAIRLGRLIPGTVTAVALSGIRSRADIDDCVRVGIRSFLVGGSLMQVPDLDDMGLAMRRLAETHPTGKS
jgi:indole-3-glycerol phosphate synthase